MNFDKSTHKLKNILVEDKYNILGFDYDEKLKKKIEPWFYPWKKNMQISPEVIDYMNDLEKKYPLISQKKIKGDIFFFSIIKADGLNLNQIQAKLQEYENDLLKRYEILENKKIAYEFKGNMYIPAHQLAFVFENGVSDDLYTSILSCHKNIEVGQQTRPFIIDLQNKRINRHKGLPKLIGSPNPKKISPKLFN